MSRPRAVYAGYLVRFAAESRAACEVARECFEARRVLQPMLETVGLRAAA